MNTTDKMAEALRCYVTGDEFNERTENQLYNQAREALRLFDAATAQPVQDLPPLPEPEELGMDFDQGWDGVKAYGFTADQMQAYARAALAATPAQAQQAGSVQAWEVVIPGGRATGQWESARIADYNQGWNDYRKAVKAALSKLAATPAPAWDAATHKELVSLLCSVADNLDDGGVSPEWEEKTCRRATELLERLGELPPAATPAPAPLTDEQIDDMVAVASIAERNMFRRFARAIERAHGIGASSGGVGNARNVD